MTIKTTIAETEGAGDIPAPLPPSAAGAIGWPSLPDEHEIARLANAFFKALPGSGGGGGLAAGPPHSLVAPAAGVVPLAPAVPGGLAAGVPALAPAGPLAAPPAPALGGIGVSPDLGAALLPAGLPPLSPGLPPAPASPPPASPLPASPLPAAAPPTPEAGKLYIYAEAAERQQARAAQPTAVPAGASIGTPIAPTSGADWLTVRPDRFPGQDDLLTRLATLPFGAARKPDPADHEASAPAAYDVAAARRDFPILRQQVNGRPLVWLDNGATTQKPQAVIDRLRYFYENENSNVHRAAHRLAARATDAYENARGIAARFLGAASPQEIVFVRGATEAINLVAQSWGRQQIGPGDEIIVSHLEHHANIVPWQMLAAEKGARLKVIPVDDHGQIILSDYYRLLSPRTKLVAVTHVSNALGTVVPVKAVVDAAHAAGARVLIDGAQSVAHLRVNLQALGADFYVFSGHKIYAPTGIGVVYGKAAVLAETPPWQGGGNMIADVTFERTLYQPPPARFEAGTGNLADAVGLGAALDYVERIGLEAIAAHEHRLLVRATAALEAIPGLRLFGSAPDKAGVLSFTLDGYRPEEVGQALDRHGIAVRAGHHCAQPILRRFGVEGTVRATFALYNTDDDVDCLITALKRLAADRR